MRCSSLSLLWAFAVQTAISSPTLPTKTNDTALQPGDLDPCTGSGALLDHPYYQADCPAKRDLLADGTCDFSRPGSLQEGCYFFCQVRTAFHIMQEIPIPGTYCRGPKPCSIPNDRTMTVQLWSGDIAVEKALNLGISGGFESAREVSVGPATFNLGENECGYFTWIGTRKTVCGSLTEAFSDTDKGICRAPTMTTANFCADDVWTGPDANEAGCFGQTVFVRLDCGTRLPLPLSQQDERLRDDGVTMSVDDLDVLLQSWVHTECKLWSHFLWFDWRIKGRGLKDDLLGPYGHNLLKDMKDRLAGVSRWTFQYTPNDADFDWVASGSIDDIDWQIPGWSMLDVGANDAGGC